MIVKTCDKCGHIGTSRKPVFTNRVGFGQDILQTIETCGPCGLEMKRLLGLYVIHELGPNLGKAEEAVS